MLKIIGIILVLVSSFCAAGMIVRDARKKLAINRAMLDFINHLYTRITYFREALDTIYSSYENETLAEAGFLVRLMDEDLYPSLNDSGLLDCFSPDTRRKLKELSDAVGRTPAQDQEKHLNICVEGLTADVEKLTSESPKRTKAFSSIIVIAGLALVLLLL